MATRNRIEPEKQAAPELALHLKYRPTRLKDVLGQDPVVKSLASSLKGRREHCFLFTGPAGTGKTTLARIGAADLGVTAAGIIEIDAASHSGIDDMRTITSALAYQGFGDNPNKAIILNECQGLSKNAWDSLLTTTEEPPDHVYFFLTSTNPTKIPAAMVTRCQTYHLKPLRFDDVMDVLEDTCKAENFETPGRVLKMVAGACGGSARAALTMLAKVHALDDDRDVADLLAQPLENAEIIDLCRMLVRRELTWPRLTETLKKLDEPAEAVRIVICAYLSACLMGNVNGKGAEELYFILRKFAVPFDPVTGNAPLLVAFGNVMFS